MHHHLHLYGILVLLIMALPVWVSAASTTAHTAQQDMAHNFVVAKNAAHKAVLVAAQSASRMPVGEAWLEGATCLTPLSMGGTSTVCAVPWDAPAIQANMPAHFELARHATTTARWQVLVRGTHCYVYGTVTAEEMAAIRTISQYTYTTALCPQKAGSTGAQCLPPLMRDANQALALPDDILLLAPPDRGISAGVVVSIIGIAP